MEALIPYALVILMILVVQMVIIRWIFRIDTQIRLLTEIRDQLLHHNKANAAARTQEYYEKEAQK
ncbi:MAG TPA: hypothetical protein VMY06_14840 [Sedimentisphaerales bacterium]|nr:hypothetical protein [Sedimentisphaerales bacterium]HUU15583.1 hypothetical protein [Sedimentisphaerales bacterium]